MPEVEVAFSDAYLSHQRLLYVRACFDSCLCGQEHSFECPQRQLQKLATLVSIFLFKLFVHADFGLGVA